MSDEPLNVGTVTYKTNSDGTNKFSEWEHLQSIIIKQHNRLVQNYFRDVTEINFNNLGSRASLKYACWMKNEDTSVMCSLRFWLFYVVTNYLKNVTEPYYGVPVEEISESRKHRPQITLKFTEDLTDVESGYQAVTGRISLRLMEKTSETITKQELINIGKEIRTQFGAAHGYLWKKGKDMATYVDKANGFDFQLLVRKDTDAKEIISKVLNVVDKTPDWKNFQYKVNSEAVTAYPTVPSKQTIMGKQYHEPRRRPTATVRFQWAECRIWGLKKPMILYDRTYTYPTALVTDSSEPSD